MRGTGHADHGVGRGTPPARGCQQERGLGMAAKTRNDESDESGTERLAEGRGFEPRWPVFGTGPCSNRVPSKRWRRERDSNPRGPLRGVGGLANRWTPGSSFPLRGPESKPLGPGRSASASQGWWAVQEFNPHSRVRSPVSCALDEPPGTGRPGIEPGPGKMEPQHGIEPCSEVYRTSTAPCGRGLVPTLGIAPSPARLQRAASTRLA